MALDGDADHLGVRWLCYQVLTCPEDDSPEGATPAHVAPDIVAFEPVKRAALACHRTQAADTQWLPGRPAASLAAEQNVLAGDVVAGWRPAAGKADLLAGL